jgi:Domain of unknown function (DUF4783)
MKRLFTLLLLSSAICSFTGIFSLDEVVQALKNGNASQMAKHFDNTIEISMPGKSNSYSKSQGEMILKDFFTNNVVKSFEVIHKGENAGSQYCIGNLVTKAATYRTTIYMKQKNDKQVLQEIRFESN